MFTPAFRENILFCICYTFHLNIISIYSCNLSAFLFVSYESANTYMFIQTYLKDALLFYAIDALHMSST